MVKAGRVVSTVLYCFTCVYFILFSFYNLGNKIYDIMKDSPISDYINFDEFGGFIFYCFIFICLSACILLTIFYKNTRSAKNIFFTWSIFISIVLIPYTLSLMFLDSFFKVIYFIPGIILVFQLSFAIWLFRKSKKKENDKTTEATQAPTSPPPTKQRNKARLAGQFLSLPLYWLSCLSFFIYTLPYSLGKKTWFFDYDGYGQELVYISLSYIACLLACTIYAISYNNILNEKKSFFIWNLFFTATVVWINQGFSEYPAFRVLLFIISLILLFQMAFSLWMFVKYGRNNSNPVQN